MMKKIVIFAIVVILLSSCSRFFKKDQPEPPEVKETPEVIAENYVSDAIDYYQAARYHEAIVGWKKALQIIPNDAEIHNFMGLAYHRTGEAG